MTIRQAKRGLAAGTLLWKPKMTIRAKTAFQRKRIEGAVDDCRLYLFDGFSAKQLAVITGCTRQAQEQKLKVGITYLVEARWIRPAEEGR